MRMNSGHKFLLVCASLLLLPSLLSAQSAKYCEPPFKGDTWAGITHFTLNGEPAINRTSDWNELYMLTDVQTTLVTGKQYTLSVTTINTLSAQFGRTNSRVWIDWNCDKDFNDPGEMVAAWDDHELEEPQSKTFTVPANAVPGASRIRVYTDMVEGGGHDTPTPCGYEHSQAGLEHHGEVEDYLLTIELGASTSNLPPEFLPVSDLTAKEGEEYRATVSATDPDGDEFEYVTIHKPTWLTVTETIVLKKKVLMVKGTPGTNDVGEDSLVVEAKDSRAGIGRETYYLTVQASVNHSPTRVDPLRPANGASISREQNIRFIWSRSQDEDQDEVYYALTIDAAKLDTIFFNLRDTFFVFSGGDLEPDETVTWYVTSYDTRGGGSTSETYSFSVAPTADVQTLPREHTWLIREFPIPSRSHVTVQVQANEKIRAVEVYDASGRLVLEECNIVQGPAGSQEAHLQVANLPAGTYSTKVVGESREARSKIQVVR